VDLNGVDLVVLVQAARQIFEDPPLDPSLERPLHSCLRLVRNIESCGLLRVLIWIELSAIESEIVTSHRLA
jgi:hypothetical protein